MIIEALEQLIECVTQENNSDKIIGGKKDYQEIAGETYEDDKSYESRMALFLEWYIFDRIPPGENQTILESLVTGNTSPWSLEQLEIYKGFTKSVHALFLVKKVKDKEVVILNLFDGQKYKVEEPQSRLIFHPNNIVEGRLLPYNGSIRFSGNYCFHPQEANKFIMREADQIADTQKKNIKEWENLDSQVKKLTSKLEKTQKQLSKAQSKLEKASSPNKLESLRDKVSTLNNEKLELERDLSNLKHQQKTLWTQKIKIEFRDKCNHLMQRLNYMNLKWERSRQIAPQDIYSS
jgi:hypothetical protein